MERSMTKMICKYQQVCPVIFGPDAVLEIGSKVKEFHGTKVLCIYDKGVELSGIAEKIIRKIEDAGIDVYTFDKVMPDAPKEIIHEAGLMAQDKNIDIVVGIGGGSSLDTAKAVAVLADNPLPVSKYYAQFGTDYIKKTKLILIPTASGTGSEVTAISVIHDEDTDAKETVLRPADMAIVDPVLTISAPPHITAASGMDALSHAIESFTTNCGNPKSDILALHAMRLIFENIEDAYVDGQNLEARTKLSLGSNFAGIAFNDASVHFGHAAAHEMGIRFHMPHGVACAITLPEVIMFSADVAPKKIYMIAEVIGIKDTEKISLETTAKLAAEKIRNLMRKLNIKTLKEQGYSREEIVSCAKAAVEKNWFVSCALKPVNVETMAQLLGKMYDDYQ